MLLCYILSPYFTLFHLVRIQHCVMFVLCVPGVRNKGDGGEVNPLLASPLAVGTANAGVIFRYLHHHYPLALSMPMS